MKISARVRNHGNGHEVQVCTGDTTQPLAISAKVSGRGSSVNGGELLMAALATCYCNDLYREAQRLGIAIEAVEVEAAAEFIDRGLSASNVTYRARVQSPEPADRIEQLLRETDAVAEVHNTLRAQVPVQLVPW
ncbi:OsmC family protein [Ramlibacter algicola]|uniref:OsmC family protein n=1 Tax=Ramlibacter algicola TaxID=2795217 RepID=A0A934Q0P8_9BURK|nr:OsmC family protein [Ramlibacter algicola]MBK0392331.1 OsmC family protein [Ramlibacter algicola]